MQMKRPDRNSVYMIMAKTIALRGTCLRARVGAILVKDNRVISIGYNGALPGEGHCTSELCSVDSPCLNTIHAEANAIYYAARAGISTIGSTLYCTHSPCRKCTEAIIQAGVAQVYYLREYRDTPFNLYGECRIEQLDDTQIEVYKKLI